MMVNEVCVTWGVGGLRTREKMSFPTSIGALTLAFAFVSLTIIKSHRPHLPSLSISTRLFCPGNARIELPAEEAIHIHDHNHDHDHDRDRDRDRDCDHNRDHDCDRDRDRDRDNDHDHDQDQKFLIEKKARKKSNGNCRNLLNVCRAYIFGFTSSLINFLFGILMLISQKQASSVD